MGDRIAESRVPPAVGERVRGDVEDAHDHRRTPVRHDEVAHVETVAQAAPGPSGKGADRLVFTGNLASGRRAGSGESGF
jgi:hypothetical protein